MNTDTYPASEGDFLRQMYGFFTSPTKAMRVSMRTGNVRACWTVFAMAAVGSALGDIVALSNSGEGWVLCFTAMQFVLFFTLFGFCIAAHGLSDLFQGYGSTRKALPVLASALYPLIFSMPAASILLESPDKYVMIKFIIMIYSLILMVKAVQISFHIHVDKAIVVVWLSLIFLCLPFIVFSAGLMALFFLLL